MKLSRLEILLVVILIILIVVPFLPYKIPEIDRYEDNNLIRLEVEVKQWSGGVRVGDGKEELDRFLDTLSDKSISKDTINLIGNTPFKSISTFIRGIPSNNEFVVYGEFVEEYSRFNEISFDVKEWYPKNKYIRIYDSMTWYKLNLNIYIILIMIIIVLILASFKINIKK